MPVVQKSTNDFALYISNAFSLNMVHPEIAAIGYSIKVTPLSALDAFDLIEEAKVPIVSAVGHPDMAEVLSDHLLLEIPMNRISVQLMPEDELLVAQYVGPRLPEGATQLPEGATIKWFFVTFEGD